MNGAFLFVFGLVWSGMVLMFDGIIAHGAYKQYESGHYPSVTGTITHSEIKTHHSSKGGTSYSAAMEYRYEVGGQKFTGEKVRFGMAVSSSANATATVNAHPVGSATEVFYNPGDPQEAVLSPGVSGSDFMGGLFITPFNMVMLGFWIWIGGWLRARFFKPVAGGVKIISDGMATRIRLPQFSALAFGIIATGGLGFISIFLVGFSTKMEPAIPLILLVIAVVYGAGFAVYIWQRRKINSGIDDLIVDEASRTIELPLTFGRKQRITVNVADIKSLSVEKILHRSDKGGVSYTYAPTLDLSGAGASVQKLADWSDETKAKDFAGWLRQKLDPNLPGTLAADTMLAEAEAEKSAAAAASEKKFEEMRRDGKSRIKISDGPEGREFYFPAARNVGTALFTTLFMVVFNGTAVFMFHLHAPILFPIVFGLVGVLLILGTFSVWFKSSRVTINSASVRLTNHWLIFSRTREFPAGDYARFATKTGMQSGSTIFTDIKLVRVGADADFAQDMEKFQGVQQVNQLVAERFRQSAGPKGVTVANSIANTAEAGWLVQEMNKALGRRA
ncbi:MAG TPA: DUF3592 domain-containing protein [Verrucomicrobiae bacterium]